MLHAEILPLLEFWKQYICLLWKYSKSGMFGSARHTEKIHMQLPEAVIHNWKFQGAGLTGLLAGCILNETLNQRPDCL